MNWSKLSKLEHIADRLTEKKLYSFKDKRIFVHKGMAGLAIVRRLACEGSRKFWWSSDWGSI